MTRWGQVQNTETTNTIHRTNRSNSALSIAPMFNLTTNLLCHKTSQQAATVQQLPSTELCLRIVWLSDGPAPRRWSPVKVSMELWARHMGRHCVVDKIVTFWGREFPFFSGSYSNCITVTSHKIFIRPPQSGSRVSMFNIHSSSLNSAQQSSTSKT